MPMRTYLPTRALEYVVEVAAELHFGRAAVKLHVSAPAITRQIKELEAKLGYRLFERSTHQVSLTPAGAAFVAEIKKGLDCFERAVDLGAAVSRGDAEVFSLGYTPMLNPSALWPLRAAFADAAPGRRLELQSAYSPQQLELISRGKRSAGLVVLPINGSNGLRVRRVWREPLALALPENHVLAKHKSVRFDKLRAEPFVWPARSVNSFMYQHLVVSSSQRGFVPNVIQEVTTVTEALDLVASGVGLAFVKASLATRLRLKGVTFRELQPPGLHIETAVAYRRDDHSESLRLFLRLLEEHANREAA
jgi:DNA-binding transcriptional LysR family regulator